MAFNIDSWYIYAVPVETEVANFVFRTSQEFLACLLAKGKY